MPLHLGCFRFPYQTYEYFLWSSDIHFQICSLGGRSRPATIESSLLFGLVNSRGADIGISVLQGEMEKKSGEFNMVFSMRQLNKICKQVDALSFSPVPERHAHMELVKLEGDYMGQTRPTAESSRSYRLHSCIYSSLKTCSPHSICIMYVT